MGFLRVDNDHINIVLFSIMDIEHLVFSGLLVQVRGMKYLAIVLTRFMFYIVVALYTGVFIKDLGLGNNGWG